MDLVDDRKGINNYAEATQELAANIKSGMFKNIIFFGNSLWNTCENMTHPWLGNGKSKKLAELPSNLIIAFWCIAHIHLNSKKIVNIILVCP